MSRLRTIARSRALTVYSYVAFTIAVAARGLPSFAVAANPAPKPDAVAARPVVVGVLLLPSTDTEPWAANVLSQRQFVVRRRLQHDFISRGFTLYNEALAQSAADVAPKIDLADPSKRTKENLAELAKRSGADWVVSIDVHEVADDPSKSDENHFHCFCRVNLKIWDAVRQEWRADGMFTGHDQGNHQSPVWLFMEAIDEATRVAVASMVDPYPVVIDMGEVGPVPDYLAGQTGPFVPQVGRPLGGISPPP